MKKTIFIFAAASLMLFGCAFNKAPDNTYTYQALNDAAQTSTNALTRLGAIEQAANPPASIAPPPEPSSYGMGIVVSMDWNGPVEPFVRRIAAITNYKVSVLGKEPQIPVIINIMAEHKSAGIILRDAGYQCGKRADIVIFPSLRTIELRYRAV